MKMDESQKKAAASNLQFLWNAALKLSAQNEQCLLPIVRQLREQSVLYAKVGAQCDSFQLSAVCNYCGSPWSEGIFRLKILHHSNKMKKRMKRNVLDTSCSSKFQKNLVMLKERRKDNVMVRTCNICAKSQKIGLRKPLAPKSDILEHSLVNENSFTEKKKRKRKKDRFSGLNPSAVVNARISLSLRDSYGVNTSCTSTINSESVLSDMTLQSDTNKETVCESKITDMSSNNISLDVSQEVKSNNGKKVKLSNSLVIHKKNKNKKKKKKKSSVSDFLKFI